MEKEIIRHHYGSVEIDDKGYLHYTLGNWTDAGWFWQGDADRTITFYVRLKHSRVGEIWDEFKEKVPFHIFKKNLLVAIRDFDIYALAGDNAVWKFGEGFYGYIEDRAYEISEETGKDKNEVIDELWDKLLEKDGRNIDTFIKFVKKHYSFPRKFNKLKFVRSYDEFENLIDGLEADLEELFFEYMNELVG